MTPIRPSFSHAFVILVAGALVSLSTSLYADGLQDASKSLRQGQTKQALEQVDSYLGTNPKDASGRFLRGVILTEMNRSGEAIAIFTKLTEDYPDLPEPYNNLAVIYAQQKQYDKAKSALEAAIRTHPAYATAHENLGDIYARMASQAYDKALQLDSSNKLAQTKLSMIHDLITVSSRNSAASTTPTVVAAVKPIAPRPPPVVVAAAEPPPKPISPPATVTKPVAAPATVTTSVSDDVAHTLAAWAEAWSRKDAKAYLAFYASDFRTPGGVSRTIWAAERTKRVTKPGKISVAIEAAG